MVYVELIDKRVLRKFTEKIIVVQIVQYFFEMPLESMTTL